MHAKTQYEIHPVANAFPMMTDQEFEGLKNDIRENGQLQSITLWRNMIVDGRNRLRACSELNIDPEFDELDYDADPVIYVISNNLHRRHLQTSQRAMVAANLACLSKGGDRRSDQFKASNDALIDDVAKLLNVSPSSVDRAKNVVENASSVVVEAVKQGELNVSLASKLVAAVPDKKEQAKVVKQGKRAVKDAIDKTKAALSKPAENKLSGFAAVKSYYDALEVCDRAAISEFCGVCLSQSGIVKYETLLSVVAQWGDR